MLALVFTFGVPVLIAVVVGVRGGRDRPRTLGDFGWGSLWTILFALAFVFAWHVAWLGALATTAGATGGLVTAVVVTTTVSGAVWFPCLMISYVFHARRGLARDV